MTNVYEVNRYRLNYMQAYVKEYSDGSKILQSYNTDVVKRTPNGDYIRLWHSWSASTSKQVSVWCGKSFRKLPYADGTYEDLTPEYVCKRLCYGVNENEHQPWKIRQSGKSKKYFGYHSKENLIYEFEHVIKPAVETKNIERIVNTYRTGMDKEIKQTYKNDKSILELFRVLNICALDKKDNTPIGILCMINNYDFKQVWNNALKSKYPDFVGLENE